MIGAVLLSLFLVRCPVSGEVTCQSTVPMKVRPETISIADFGGVGDGRKMNTWAFEKAVYRIQHLRRRGGTTLYVPPGVWLTGSFNLTSHMTLYLARGATIKSTTDTSKWPVIDPLPSYGRGRELPGGRYASFIQGNRLHDIIITGDKGIIDGQGGVWWSMWRRRILRFTRPNLLELMHSQDILIFNLIFKNSPFWNIHPVYCSNVVIRYVTVLAPYDSPNTDGIDPDSSTNVCIEDCYIATGDDMVAVKSGWDEYGIAYGRPSSGITIRRVTGTSPFAGIAIGSEASGGVEGVLAEDIRLHDTGVGIHIKTSAGRGGYIRDVTVAGVVMSSVGRGVVIEGDAGDHPDGGYDRGAVTAVERITVRDVWGVGVREPGSIRGMVGRPPFTGICLRDVKLWGASGSWRCGAVSGAAMGVYPTPCAELLPATATSSKAGFCSGS